MSHLNDWLLFWDRLWAEEWHDLTYLLKVDSWHCMEKKRGGHGRGSVKARSRPGRRPLQYCEIHWWMDQSGYGRNWWEVTEFEYILKVALTKFSKILNVGYGKEELKMSPMSLFKVVGRMKLPFFVCFLRLRKLWEEQLWEAKWEIVFDMIIYMKCLLIIWIKIPRKLLHMWVGCSGGSCSWR